MSSHAIDHPNRQGTDQSLAEAAHVLKPSGGFLLMIIANEKWAKFAFGPLLSHGGTRGADWWTKHVQKPGFQILETADFYLLARRL